MVTILSREIDNFYDVPFIGPWPSKIGHIQKLWATPCSPSPTIWVKAFWHDLPWLVWSFVKPEAVDLTLNRFREGHHSKKRRRFPVMHRQGPDIPVPKGAAGWAAFTVSQAAQRVGFYLLVVDATLDFAINWQSTAYMWEGCAVEDAFWANGRCTTGPIILPEGEFGPIGIWDHRDHHGFFADVNTVDSLAGYDSQVTASITFDVLEGEVTNAQLLDFAQGIEYATATPHPTADGRWQMSFGIRNWQLTNPARSYGIAVQSSGPAVVDFTGSSIELYGNKRKGLTWDP